MGEGTENGHLGTGEEKKGRSLSIETTYTRSVPDSADHLIHDAPGRGCVSHVSLGVQGDSTHSSQVSAQNKQKKVRG